jgi:adenine phosphoribosyltransferase
MDELRRLIRDVPDFPKKGILFKDITTLLREKEGFARAVRALADACRPLAPDLVVCVESRGFLFGAPVAYLLGAGVVPVRKPGKLPARTIREEYALEYGSDALELHEGAIEPGQCVVVMDDLLATGGTAAAAGRLVGGAGGVLAGYAFLVELAFLGGRARLGGVPVVSLIAYDAE